MSRHILGQFHKIVPSQFRLVLFCEGLFGCGHFEGFLGVILSADGFESLPICYCASLVLQMAHNSFAIYYSYDGGNGLKYTHTYIH